MVRSQIFNGLGSGVSLFSMATLLSVLSVAAFKDLRERRIPNQLILIGLAAAFAIAFFFGFQATLSASIGVLSALFVFFPVYLWGALGAGDVKLLMVVGAFLGTQQLLFATLFIFLAGGALALLYSYWMYRFDAQPKLPYAVSILAGVTGYLALHF